MYWWAAVWTGGTGVSGSYWRDELAISRDLSVGENNESLACDAHSPTGGFCGDEMLVLPW